MKKSKKIEKTNENTSKNKLKSAKFDPFGSYTGAPTESKCPVQDADDL